MPNNENYYRIKLEFANFLRGLSEFILVHTEQDNYINVRIQAANFSRINLLVSHHRPQHLVEQIFQELEKDYIDGPDLLDLGRLFKNYWLLLKQIHIDRTYYLLTPGMMTGLFILLHIGLLAFPASKGLVYSSLIADFYGLGFWLFSIWSFKKTEQALHELENKLINKINFLRLLSPLPQADELYLESSSSSLLSLLPSYQDVLLEDAARIPRNNTSYFFYPARFNNESDDNNENAADPRTERCYSI